MSTRDEHTPGAEPTSGDEAAGNEQTLAERVMQGEGIGPDVSEAPGDDSRVDEPPVGEPPMDEPPVNEPPVNEPPADEPVAGDQAGHDPVDNDPVVEEPSVEQPFVEEPFVEERATDEPAFSDVADDGPQDSGVLVDDRGAEATTEASTETHGMPAVDEPDHRERADDRERAGDETQVIPADQSAAEETRMIPADESASEETQVIPADQSAAEETRMIPSQHEAEEPAVERTAVLPPQEDPPPASRTDHAEDDLPRSRTERPVDRDARTVPAAAGGAAAAGAATGGAAATADDRPDGDASTDRPAKPAKPPRTTDRPLGALALFVLRVVTAGIFGVHGVQKLLDIPGTREFFGTFPLPQAELFGLITAAGELAVALGLLLGLAVRIAGLGAMAIAIGALVLVRWTEWPIAGSPAGFSGELELLLAAVGLVFFLLGGGRIGLDRMFRKNP